MSDSEFLRAFNYNPPVAWSGREENFILVHSAFHYLDDWAAYFEDRSKRYTVPSARDFTIGNVREQSKELESVNQNPHP